MSDEWRPSVVVKWPIHQSIMRNKILFNGYLFVVEDKTIMYLKTTYKRTSLTISNFMTIVVKNDVLLYYLKMNLSIKKGNIKML